MKKIYLSYPISAAEPRKVKKVQEVRDELRKHLIVFDPMSIKDVDWLTVALSRKNRGQKTYSIPFTDNDDLQKDIKVDLNELKEVSVCLEDQTIARDYDLISQSDYVAVYYYDPSLPSPGVEREIRFAKDSGKPVILYLPAKTMSPFRKLDIAEHFKKPKDFIDYFKKL